MIHTKNGNQCKNYIPHDAYQFSFCLDTGQDMIDTVAILSYMIKLVSGLGTRSWV